jgi:hypothetical protein
VFRAVEGRSIAVSCEVGRVRGPASGEDPRAGDGHSLSCVWSLGGAEGGGLTPMRGKPQSNCVPSRLGLGVEAGSLIRPPSEPRHVGPPGPSNQTRESSSGLHGRPGGLRL